MTLAALDSENLSQLVFTIATPKTLCDILHAHSEILAVRRYLFENADNAQREVEKFVRGRLIDLKPKTSFPHEPAFCALAVALETLPMPVAEGFLSELAALQIAEMPLSSRVASLCMQRRRKLLISNTLVEFKIKPIPIPDAPSPKRLKCVSTESTYLIFKAAA